MPKEITTEQNCMAQIVLEMTEYIEQIKKSTTLSEKDLMSVFFMKKLAELQKQIDEIQSDLKCRF